MHCSVTTAKLVLVHATRQQPEIFTNAKWITKARLVMETIVWYFFKVSLSQLLQYILSLNFNIIILSIWLRTCPFTFLSDTTLFQVWGRQCISDDRDIYQPGCHDMVNGTTTISYCMCDWDMCNYDLNPTPPTPQSSSTITTKTPTTQNSSTKIDGLTILNLVAVVFLFLS